MQRHTPQNTWKIHGVSTKGNWYKQKEKELSKIFFFCAISLCKKWKYGNYHCKYSYFGCCKACSWVLYFCLPHNSHAFLMCLILCMASLSLFNTWLNHRGLLRFCSPRVLYKKNTREESKISNCHTTLFQNSSVLVSWPHSP